MVLCTAFDAAYTRAGVAYVAAVTVCLDPPLTIGADLPASRLEMTVVETEVMRAPAHIPYVSGYLAFRELPGVEALFPHLRRRPDILMINGQGLVHPRRAGFATHAGVALATPAVGVSRRIAFGKPEDTGRQDDGPGFRRVHLAGEHAGWRYDLGGRAPIYISPGHGLSVAESRCAAAMCDVRRLPVPLALADRLARHARRTGSVRSRPPELADGATSRSA